jgi:TonB family protein
VEAQGECLVKDLAKVTPIYPTLMQSARMTGQVVLDAIIHPDGTIGDIKVLRSTNDAFAQSAIAAVKQWRDTAPGFEGIAVTLVVHCPKTESRVDRCATSPPLLRVRRTRSGW